jgi:hypothetical protein
MIYGSRRVEGKGVLNRGFRVQGFQDAKCRVLGFREQDSDFRVLGFVGFTSFASCTSEWLPPRSHRWTMSRGRVNPFELIGRSQA